MTVSNLACVWGIRMPITSCAWVTSSVNHVRGRREPASTLSRRHRRRGWPGGSRSMTRYRRGIPGTAVVGLGQDSVESTLHQHGLSREPVGALAVPVPLASPALARDVVRPTVPRALLEHIDQPVLERGDVAPLAAADWLAGPKTGVRYRNRADKSKDS